MNPIDRFLLDFAARDEAAGEDVARLADAVSAIDRLASMIR